MSYDWKLPKNHWVTEEDISDLYRQERLQWDYQSMMRTNIVIFDDFGREFLKQRRPETILLTRDFWVETFLPKKIN